MPRLRDVPPEVRTEYLGQFTRAHAERIAEALEAHDIVWWFKEPGYISRIWEYGVRLFVDRQKLDEARALADAITTESDPEAPAPDARP